jgi:hypothetical protein
MSEDSEVAERFTVRMNICGLHCCDILDQTAQAVSWITTNLRPLWQQL